MNGRRIAVTGLGLLTPVGNDVKSSWAAIRAGESGIRRIDRFDVSEFSTRFGGALREFDRDKYLPAKEARRMDEFMHYGIAAGIQALEDSGLQEVDFEAERFGVAVGSGIGGIKTIEETALQIKSSGPRKVTPFFVPGSIINMISGTLSIRFGLKGPNIAVVTACTTGTHNIGLAANMINNDQADIMLVGGAEMATSPVGLGGFCAARALSTRNEEPERASRPWDKDRDGFALSDGAGVMVIEEMEHAKARGAKIYAELVGFGMSGDAYHMTAPSEGGEGAARCMQNALRSANMSISDIDYINAHGTSTVAGDIAENEAIKRVFGSHAFNLCVSSTKSMIGHLLGASGAAEAIISVLTLHNQIITPTINLDEPEEGCDLDYVPHTARKQAVDVVLTNSFGFGGTNGSLIFKRA
ncbi:MAG: beta-ketoacyl-[acyl-carrier-protein] synthase II [Gammaproteobacteria bacterium]|nr:beta-ketoacyl-[acyl-carrier-protein] synthase II [Gammaproteobacteria bacterium]HBW84868.1 beta-ketoacyl-[acyl-carrier-protein] synthase II [Gammaproteobacteria bacterium]